VGLHLLMALFAFNHIVAAGAGLGFGILIGLALLPIRGFRSQPSGSSLFAVWVVNLAHLRRPSHKYSLQDEHCDSAATSRASVTDCDLYGGPEALLVRAFEPGTKTAQHQRGQPPWYCDMHRAWGDRDHAVMHRTARRSELQRASVAAGRLRRRHAHIIMII
jgi:hypothetical protein